MKAKNISRTISNLNRLYDAELKAFLAEKQILAIILQECVVEFNGCTLKDIAEKYIIDTPQVSDVGVDKDTTNQNANAFSSLGKEKIRELSNEDSSITEGLVRYDIRFLAKAPDGDGYVELIINVEAQRNYNPGYPIVSRGIYYASRMISAQKDVEFAGEHYDQIKKVYSIWICYRVPEYMKNTIACYEVKERFLRETPKTKGAERKSYDLLSVIIIGLGDPEKSGNSPTLKLLSTVLNSSGEKDEKKEILKKEFGISMTSETEERIENMCDFGIGIYEEAYEEAYEKAYEKASVETREKTLHEIAIKLYEAGNQAKEIAEVIGKPLPVVLEWITADSLPA